MKRLLILTLLFLTACSSSQGPASFFAQTPTPFNLNLESTSEEIQTAMLESATRWTTLQMNGSITWYLPDGSTQSFSEQVWLDPLNSRYHIELSAIPNSADKTVKLSDGKTITNIGYLANTVEQFPYPDFARVGQYIPPVQAGVAYPNPIWGQIGTPLSEMAFSSDFAQSDGTFIPLAIESVAGRSVLVVSWTFRENASPSWKLWLDTQTALILKMQEFGKEGGETLQGERVVESITYDASFDDTVFALPADIPQVIQPTRAASNPVITESAPASAEEAGELYFFLQPRQQGQSIELVKVSGACVYNSANCPPLEKISAPFLFNFTLNALSWSPDGKYAAFSYSDQPNGTPTKLWLFDAGAKTWNSLAEFPFIDPPFWSPDGAWIAFRTQDGVGGEDVYVIRADGSELKSVSTSLPPEGRPYIMDGWFGDSIIMRSALLSGSDSLFLVSPADGSARPMFNFELTKSQFVSAPDASSLAFAEYDEATRVHSLKVMDASGSNSATVAQFTGGSIYPLVWSPDSNLLAFNYYGDTNGMPKAQVFVVSRAEENLSLVYEGSTVGRLLFSPNGKYLLVEETTSASGGHLYWVNLATLDLNILEAPGLSTEYNWYAPSWRP
ncbi:MAG: PD40 domain-containing protein [Anaerolineales bacterium]|nr:PD40 domain-containing protein [Anaerolineales bacterium]